MEIWIKLSLENLVGNLPRGINAAALMCKIKHLNCGDCQRQSAVPNPLSPISRPLQMRRKRGNTRAPTSSSSRPLISRSKRPNSTGVTSPHAPNLSGRRCGALRIQLNKGPNHFATATTHFDHR